MAWSKEDVFIFPGNYSLSLYIYKPHVISLSNNNIYIYIMGLTCVQMVEN